MPGLQRVSQQVEPVPRVCAVLPGTLDRGPGATRRRVRAPASENAAGVPGARRLAGGLRSGHGPPLLLESRERPRLLVPARPPQGHSGRGRRSSPSKSRQRQAPAR